MRLRDKLDKILSKGGQRITRSAAKGARERIEKGLAPPLQQSTLELRKDMGIGGTKPLFATGALHRSIKSTKDGLEMLEYGLYHHYGYTTKKVPTKLRRDGSGFFANASKQVPARPFIFPSEKEILDPMKKTIMALRKALTTRTRRI